MERPILFSAPMVRAIIEGRKTQTRRPIKPVQPRDDGMWPAGRNPVPDCPYGQPGDGLWVRETWAVQRFEPCLPHERDWQELHSPTIRYLADGATQRVQGDRATGVGIYHGPVEKSRPSIHMPRWASRITLEITDVRVQRVQNISEADALEEGCRSQIKHSAAFADLWDSINAKRGFGWTENPWVWAITFKRVKP